ncbi:hypothetical protein RB195_022268 [Necator americanus]|uniref:Uncharacterized protein n=1 Tax=Necator americanus TaxID=51031 RepID=A0ABR1EEM2_NECAM
MPFTLLLLDTETNNFTSFYKLLKEWLHEQCERSGTSFFKRSSYAKGSSYSLRCNRAGTYEKATTSNATSSKKDVISCSCFMNVHIADDGKVNIKGCLGHVGHDIEPALLRLNNTQELLRTLLEEHSMDYILRLLKRDYSAKTSRLWFVDRNANSRAEFLVELLIRAVEDLADSAEIRDRRRLAASSFRVQQSTKCHRWALKHYENRPEKVKRVAEKKWELQGKDVADKYQVLSETMYEVDQILSTRDLVTAAQERKQQRTQIRSNIESKYAVLSANVNILVNTDTEEAAETIKKIYDLVDQASKLKVGYSTVCPHIHGLKYRIWPPLLQPAKRPRHHIT